MHLTFCCSFVETTEHSQPPQEMVIDTDPQTGTKYPRYLIYDAVRIQGRDIMQDSFHMRYERIMVGILHLSEQWSDKRQVLAVCLVLTSIEPQLFENLLYNTWA